MKSANHTGLMSRVVLTLLAASLLCLGPSQASSPPPADTGISLEVQRGIETALREKVAAISGEKNDKGEPFKRAIFSKTFHRVDDGTYLASLHVDKAMGANLVVERHRLTVTGAGRDWTVGKDELEDTFEGLHRRMLGDEQCFSFDTFTFAREGITVKASKGSMCKDFYDGKVQEFDLSSADLSYEYEPPIKQEEMLFGLLKKEREPDLVFAPEYVKVECDPGSCEQIISTSLKGLAPIKMDQADAGVKHAFEKYKNDTEKALRENPFAGFTVPDEPDHKEYKVTIKKAGPNEDILWLGYDNYDPKEITVSATFFEGQPIYQYYSEETRKSGIDPYDLEGRPDADARFYDLQSLKGTVEMGTGDGETLIGDITYGLKTKRAFNSLPFRIDRLIAVGERRAQKSPNMTINSIQDGDGNELTWARTSATSGLVVFPKQIPLGADLKLRLQFVNTDSIYKLTSSFSYVDRGGWLPFVRFADFIEDFDLTLRVPVKYKTLGIGKKIS
ncbi:MAG TPA: hypothetical protein VFG76_05020, partial [Candidatus Polarisedimenticolia bacterium]|nr:hypothetical protein [Candidatus Polarisedimenticolia bacterium]